MNCDHIIGVLNDYDNTRTITSDDLKQHIKSQKELKDRFADRNFKINAYTIKEYADRRRNTDLFRFNYCPVCGAKIDWRVITHEPNTTATKA